ncbi:hypothetical protein BHE74_00008830 [Ensete ventricosum]|nr:hypothetical protein BHE74_00008830 [Ensete ventricosum]
MEEMNYGGWEEKEEGGSEGLVIAGYVLPRLAGDISREERKAAVWGSYEDGEKLQQGDDYDGKGSGDGVDDERQ